MKSIKKIKESSKAIAGTALLVGATLTAGGAAVVAQDSGSSGNLGDYPAPFINDDGEISSTIVMGEDAAAIDVVAASNIAGQLGNDAFSSETVSIEAGGTAGTWSAENGVTLDRQNSPLFLSDSTDTERTNLDGSDINALETTSFESEDNEEVEVEHEVDVTKQHQNFNAKVGDFDDPVLHVTNPINPEDGAENNLFQAEVEFSETMDFTEAGTNNPDSAQGQADEWIEDGDTIELFGTEYTFSDESTQDELVLYGSSDRVEVNTGEETTVTVDGNELTVGATYVSDSNPVEATVTVDGSTETVEEGDSVGPSGNVRVSDIYRTGPDGQGRVAFAQGSDELVINYGDTSNLGDVEVDGDSIDGVSVAVDGDTGATKFQETDGMTFYFGAADSDENYVEAGSSYEDPLFGLEFHYGGLTGDTAENPAAAFTVQAEEDDAASIELTSDDGESATVDFVNVDSGDGTLAADDGEEIATLEGEALEEDDHVVLNANQDAGLYQVTELTNEASNIYDGGAGTEGDVSVTLQNVVTGDSVTIEEEDVQYSELSDTDSDSTDDDYEMTSESIEGKDFNVAFNYDGDVSFERTSGTGVQMFPTVYGESGSAVAFTESTTFYSEDDVSSGTSATLELPSTISSSEERVNIDTSFSVTSSTPTFSVDIDSETQTLYTDTGTSGTQSAGSADTYYTTFDAGQTEYILQTTIENMDSSAGDVSHTVHVAGETSDVGTGDSVSPLGPAVGVFQPQDDEDQENAYFFDPTITSSAGELGGASGEIYYTGPEEEGTEGALSANAWATAELDSEDNVEVGYNDYGAYTMFDTDADESDVFNLHLPSGQSTSGLAVTGADGELSSEGGSTSEDVESMSPTGWSSSYTALDSDETISNAKQDSNLILVGGPSVNSLVGELVEANETMAASEYTEGQGMVQLVQDAFTEGNDALVVAGYAGEDTRQAGQFLANYEQNSEAMEGSTQVTIDTAEGTVVQ